MAGYILKSHTVSVVGYFADSAVFALFSATFRFGMSSPPAFCVCVCVCVCACVERGWGGGGGRCSERRI